MPRLEKTNVRTIHDFSRLINGFLYCINLGLIYKEYVLVKRLVIMLPVMFVATVVYAEDEREVMVEIFRSDRNIKNQMRIPDESF